MMNLLASVGLIKNALELKKQKCIIKDFVEEES